MTPELAALFDKLADLTPEERVVYFAAHPADSALRREVEELLAHDNTDNDALYESVTEVAQAFLQPDAVGSRCGAFQLVRVIGRGGMGVVYFAERVDGEVTQRAAVKLLHPGWTEIDRERFLQEREILASLAHPNIAHLLDAGHLTDGQPYFAMEYVDGKPIDQHCDGLSVRQKIELFLKVCEAVEYLHRNQVVHRDVKPNNILVTASGEAKLLDFGISKMLSVERDLTATHLRLLTPNYASPEQVSGGEVGPGSDIYSLGAVLHALLTGQAAHEGQARQLPPEWKKSDLGLIVTTALRAEPRERYLSVEEFAGDLKAFLGSRPVRARKGNRSYLIRTFARRHRLPVLLIPAFALALATFAFFWYRSQVPVVKNLRPERLTANTNELPVEAAALSPDGKSIAYSDPLGVHLRDVASGDTRLLPGTTGHVLVQWMPDGVGMQTRVEDSDGEKMMVVFPSGSSPPVPAPSSETWLVSPDGKRRAMTPRGQQRIFLEESNSGHARELWNAAPNSTLIDFRWSPDSRRIAVVSSRRNVSILDVVDVASQKTAALIPESRNLWIGSLVWVAQNRIVFNSRERVRAAGYNSNLWEVRLDAHSALVSEGLRKLTAWTDFPIRSGSLSTDGKRLVFVRSFDQRDVYVAEIDAGKSHLGQPRRLTLDLGDDYPTGWTRDSRTVLLASDRNGPINIFRQDLDKQMAEPLVTMPGIQIIPRMSPGGDAVLFCDIVPKQRTCRLMSVPLRGGTPSPLLEIPDIGDFRCSRAGACIAVQRSPWDPRIVVSEVNLRKGLGREIYRDAEGRPGLPDISPDGKLLAAPSGTKIIVRSFSTGAIVREIAVRGVTNLVTLDYSVDGKGFFSGERTGNGSRQFYIDFAGKATLLSHQPGSDVTWSIPSPDGRYLAMLLYSMDSNVYVVEGF